MLSRAEVSRWRDLLEAKLGAVGKEMGVKLTLGRCSYGETATFKLEVSRLNVDGTSTSREAEDFKALARSYGLKPEDLGRTFKDEDGRTYKIIGLRRKAPVKPFLCERVGTGKVFIFRSATLCRLLNSSIAPPRNDAHRLTPPPGSPLVRSEEAILADIRRAYLDLEPENLTCDGEIRSTAVITSRRKDAETRRDRLIAELGRKPTEDELWRRSP